LIDIRPTVINRMLGVIIGPVPRMAGARQPGGALTMPSPVISAPAVPLPPTAPVRTPSSDLPVARIPEPDGCGTPLTIELDERGDTTLLRVVGEIDLLTVEQLRAALDQALAGPRRTVVVDLQGVSFVACAGIGLLVDMRWRARRRGVRLHVVASRPVARTAALLDLPAALGLLDEPA
jgi:anti-anti-sigma factor